MAMVRKSLIAFAVVIVGFLAYIQFRPSEMHVERTAHMSVQPEVVFGLIDHLRSWERWDPWNELDPNQTTTYSGPEQGEGAVAEWSGNDQVGKGRMELVKSEPPQRVVVSLQFLEPFESEATTEFVLKPMDGGEGTEVTWSMSSEYSYMEKAMGLFVDFEHLIGNDFEKGLAKLEQVALAEAERRAKAAAEAETSARAEAEPEPEAESVGGE